MRNGKQSDGLPADTGSCEKMTDKEYLENIRMICRRYHAEKVVLFGSRAKGLNGPTSDFDIAVYGVEDTQPIADELDELPTLFSSDVVNMESCRNPRLIREVERYGIQI